MPEQVTRPPHAYVPPGPVETQPFEGGYQSAEVRREALAAVLDGVPLGAYDKRMTEWLVQLDDTTCRTFASVMWRCRAAGLPERVAATGQDVEWGVRFTIGGVNERPLASEEDARTVVASMRENRPEFGAVLITRVPEVPAGPWKLADDPATGETGEGND